MRKLMAAFAIVLAVGLPTRAWALLGFEGVSYDGSLEVSAVRATNESDQNDGANPSDRRSDVDTRTRLGVNLPVTDTVNGRIEFTRTGSRYGRNFAGTAGASNDLNQEQDNIEISNAYIKWDMWAFAWMLGRQYTGEAGDLVWNIGPRSDDNLSINAIDGLGLHHMCEWMLIDLFFGKARENNVQGAANDINEVSLKNVMVTVPNLLPGGSLFAGAVMGSNSNTSNTSDSTKLDIYRVGARGGINENFLTYRAEFLFNGGENLSASPKTEYKGNALDLGVGVNLPENGSGMWSFGGSYLMASGDDNLDDNDDESFRDLTVVGVTSTDRYYGEIFGRSNVLGTLGQGIDTGNEGPGLSIVHLNVLYKPSWWEKSSMRVDYYNLSATEDSQTQMGNSVKIGDYGDEVDLTIGYMHSDNVTFEGGYAWLSPDDKITGIAANAPDDNITKFFARAKIAWGGEDN